MAAVKSLPARLSLYAAAIVIAIYSAFPIYWMFISSLREPTSRRVKPWKETSSGKTWTMIGSADNPGVMPLSIQGLFAELKAKVGVEEYLVRVSYMEIYNEEIKDLLDP